MNASNPPLNANPDRVARKRTSKAGQPTPRLCWSRKALVKATGLSYRSIVNLQQRGLLQPCLIGLNVVCYTDASVRALFGEPITQNKEMP